MEQVMFWPRSQAAKLDKLSSPQRQLAPYRGQPLGVRSLRGVRLDSLLARPSGRCRSRCARSGDMLCPINSFDRRAISADQLFFRPGGRGRTVSGHLRSPYPVPSRTLCACLGDFREPRGLMPNQGARQLLRQRGPYLCSLEAVLALLDQANPTLLPMLGGFSVIAWTTTPTAEARIWPGKPRWCLRSTLAGIESHPTTGLLAAEHAYGRRRR